MTNTNESIVYVVDDDALVRRSLKHLLESYQFSTKLYASAEAFLCNYTPPKVPGCILLDIQMTGLSGLELQSKLLEAGVCLPIIFLTGHGSVQDTVRAMKTGAVDFMLKPYNVDVLIKSIHQAIEQDRQLMQKCKEMHCIHSLYETLTPRERQVFSLVTKGLLNKQIAWELGVCEKTIKVHRAHVMEKMKVRSLADLVRASEQLNRGAQPEEHHRRRLEVSAMRRYEMQQTG